MFSRIELSALLRTWVDRFRSEDRETVGAAAIQPLALGTHALPVVMPANTVLRRIVVQIFPLRRNKFVPVKP